MSVVAMLTGLCVAWGGAAALVSPLGRALGDPERMATRWLGQAALWVLLGIVLSVVVFWERQPLASLWIRPLAWESLGWGLVLALAIVRVVIPVRERLRRAAGLGGYEAGVEKVLAAPLAYRLAAVVTAGVVEETLFNGYAVTRVLLLTDSLWLAGALAVLVFAGLHVPFWGAGPGLAFLVSGAASTAFFIWRQDLLAMIVAHVAVDAWGLVIAPSYTQWWRDERFSS